MRDLVLAIVTLALGLIAPAGAFEIEEERIFGNPQGRELSIISTTDVPAIAPVMEAFMRHRPEARIRYMQAASIDNLLVARLPLAADLFQ